MRAQRETVGHARHVVSGLGDAVGIIVPVGGRQVPGVAQVMIHQPPDDLDGLPLVLATPVFGIFMNMEPLGTLAVMATLAAGTPAITFIGAMGAAVTVTLARGGLLIAILILPLVIPLLVFGVAAALLLHVMAMYLPPLQRVLAVAPLTGAQWVMLPLAALTLLAVMELQKVSWNRRVRRSGH